MNTRYCCICSQPGHHSHECPKQEAFRQQWKAPAPKPQPVPIVIEDAIQEDDE